MLKRTPHKEEAIAGAEEVRQYGENHKRHARLQFGGLLKDIRALNKAGRYLEVGSGPGILAAMVAEENPGVDLTAMDLSPEMVAVARETIETENLQSRVRCVRGDVNDKALMEALGPFDLVYSAFSLHHFADPEASIKNIWRAVGDHGVLILYDLKRVWWLYVLPFHNGFFESIRAAYRPKEIGDFLRKIGITRFKIKTTVPYFMQSLIAWH